MEGGGKRQREMFCTFAPLQNKTDCLNERNLSWNRNVFSLGSSILCLLSMYGIILIIIFIIYSLFHHSTFFLAFFPIPALFLICSIFHHQTAFSPFSYFFSFLSFLLLLCRKETIKKMQAKTYWCIHVGFCRIKWNELVICRNKINQLQLKYQPVQYCNSNIYSKLMWLQYLFPCICLASPCYKIHSVSLNEKWII